MPLKTTLNYSPSFNTTKRRKKKIKFIKSSYKKNKINIISDEGFTSPFSNKNLDIYRKLDNTIKLLKKSFNLKIIVVVKKQKNWLKNKKNAKKPKKNR